MKAGYRDNVVRFQVASRCTRGASRTSCPQIGKCRLPVACILCLLDHPTGRQHPSHPPRYCGPQAYCHSSTKPHRCAGYGAREVVGRDPRSRRRLRGLCVRGGGSFVLARAPQRGAQAINALLERLVGDAELLRHRPVVAILEQKRGNLPQAWR